MQQKELELKEREILAKIEDSKARLALDTKKSDDRNSVEGDRIAAQERIAEGRNKAQVLGDVIGAESKGKEIDSKELIEGVKAGLAATKGL